MKRIALASLVCITLAAGTAFGVHRRRVERARIEAMALKVEHDAAFADSERILRESKAFWGDRNLRLKLQNDELDLENERLAYDIAGLEDRPRNRAKIDQEETVVRNDRLSITLISDLDTGEPTLTPREEDRQIEEHNRKFPHNLIAPTSDLTKEMERFQSQIRGLSVGHK